MNWKRPRMGQEVAWCDRNAGFYDWFIFLASATKQTHQTSNAHQNITGTSLPTDWIRTILIDVSKRTRILISQKAVWQTIRITEAKVTSLVWSKVLESYCTDYELGFMLKTFSLKVIVRFSTSRPHTLTQFHLKAWTLRHMVWVPIEKNIQPLRTINTFFLRIRFLQAWKSALDLQTSFLTGAHQPAKIKSAFTGDNKC